MIISLGGKPLFEEAFRDGVQSQVQDVSLISFDKNQFLRFICMLPMVIGRIADKKL